MSILAALFFGTAAIGLMARDEIRTTRNINNTYARMQADGCDRKTDYTLEYEKRREADIDWTYGDRALYPKRLWPFFEHDICARIEYGNCVAKQKMICAGYKPIGSPGLFKLSVYDPFASYENRYGNAERAFFQTQKRIRERGYAMHKCVRCDIEWNPIEEGDACPRCGFNQYTEV